MRTHAVAAITEMYLLTRTPTGTATRTSHHTRYRPGQGPGRAPCARARRPAHDRTGPRERRLRRVRCVTAARPPDTHGHG